MYKLEIFCLPEQKEVVLNTLHETGVDKIGNYDHCWVISSVKGSHSYSACGQAVEESIRLGRTDCEYL